MADPEPFDRGLPPQVACAVCAAPALPVDGTCVFCRSPLHERGDPAGLLEYVARRLPGADVTRAGLLHRGPVQKVEFTLDGTAFRVQARNEALEFAPELSPERWSALVVRAVGEAAFENAELRGLLSRAGWSWPA
jgi:hypothetical protein